MTRFPSLSQAQHLWQKGFDYRCVTTDFVIKDEYVFHTKGVAFAAQKIAQQTKDINPEKAYVLGLLHDYGKKYCEKETKKFHGRVGYEELMELGYSEAARISLTHSFPRKYFNNKFYPTYTLEDLSWVHQHLDSIEYDDYDRLIQLCDMFFEGLEMVCFEKRFFGILRRYNLNDEAYEELLNNANMLKSYFDKKIGIDVYRLLNIKAL